MFATINNADYQGKNLTYDSRRSEKVSLPIYHDVNGQLYMPLNERFVTVAEVVAVLASYQNRLPEAI